MTRTISSTQFVDESVNIGRLEWEFGDHTALHLIHMEQAAAEAFADTMHDHFESCLDKAATELESLLFESVPSDNEEFQTVAHIHIELEGFGTLSWTPSENMKFRLDTLAERNERAYANIMLIISQFMVESMLSFVDPLCAASFLSEECIINVLGEPISNN